MSSRALRRLQQEANIIKLSGAGVSASSEEESNQPGFTSPVRSKKKNKSATSNPFAAVSAREEGHTSSIEHRNKAT